MNVEPVPVEAGASVPDAAVQNPMLFVQALKGAPASVLLALAITGRFMSHKELQLWTRCGKNQVTFALQALTQLGWALGKSLRGPWILARPLGEGTRSLFDASNPFKGLSSSSDSLNLIEREEVLILSPRRRELLELLRAAGIREPTASELADLPHVTIEYARAHIQGARANGLLIGSAIEGMRLQAPPPAIPTPKTRQADQAEKIRKFTEGI